jgi:F0F1-type ATP synthase membrane subunit b/b'
MGWMELNAIESNRRLKDQADQLQHQAMGRTLEEIRAEVQAIRQQVDALKTVLVMVQDKISHV